MKFFTKFSMKNAFVIFLAVVLIIVGGVYSGSGIKEEAMPNISIPVVTVFTVYPGAAPNDIASSVTRPIQKSLSGIQGVTDIKGISNENVSIVVAQFDYSADVDKGVSNIQAAVDKVSLPQNAQKPSVSKVTMGSFSAMTYAIESSRNINDLAQFVNSKLQPELTGVTGVSSVNVQGLKNSNIYIKLDAQKMKDYNLTLQSVQNFISANNISFPVGDTEINQKDMAIRISNQYNNIDDIRSIPIIIPPNTSQIMQGSFQKVTSGMNQMGNAINELGKSVGQLGQSMGQLAKGVGTTSKSMGELIGNNTQSIAVLSVIQKQEAIILSQQAVLSSPKSTAEDRMKAAATITQANAVIQSSGDSLQQLLITQQQMAKSLNQSTSMPKQGAGSGKAGSAPKAAGKSNDPTQANTQLKVIFLKDIADISTGDGAAKYFARSNYKAGIVLNIFKTDDANTVQMAKDVDQKISELSKDNGDIKFNKIDDSSKAVKDSVSGMMEEGIVGAIFAMLVIALFLRNIKSTVIAVVSIPLSIFITLIFLPRFGITLNTMSLGGIAVAVGRIVDDSIVVIENIYRRLSLSKNPEEDKAQLVEQATHEVGSAIAASTITTVGVFLPLSFISGLIGRVFIPFAYTVVICILASLLVALTVVPVMSKVMLSPNKIKHTEKEGIMARGYKRILNTVLNHRLAVLGLCLVILLISGGLLRRIGIQFMPSSDSNIINIKLTMPVGTSADKTNSEALKFEEYLKGRADIVNVASIVGDTSSTSSSPLSNQGSNVAAFSAVLKENEDIKRAVEELRTEAKKFDKVGESMTISPQSVSGTQADNIEVIVNGNNVDDIAKAAALITNKLKQMDTLSNVTNNISQKRQEISISVDPTKAAEKGLTAATAAGLLKSYLGFTDVGTINNDSSDKTTSVDIMLGYKAQDIDTVNKIKNLEIQGATDVVNIGDIASVEQKNGPASISELNGKQYAAVDGDITVSDTNKVTKDARSAIDSIKQSFPSGVTYELQGSNKNISEGFSQMAMAMVVAIMMVYLIMVIAFGEPITPFAILFSLPFAGVGAIAALFIAHQPLTVSGMVGMLMLIGIVVTNAIVLLDRVKTNRRMNMNVREALLEAGSVRLRPILMTAISTVMALIPLALGFSHGSLISQGLGIAVLGGLVFSTILTLIIVPVMYSLLNLNK